MDIQSAVSRAKPVMRVFSEENVTFLAGSIAYSAFVSLVPLVMFFLLGVSVLGAPELQQQIIEVATESVSPSVGGVLEVMIEEQRDAGPNSTISASLIGVLTLVWGAIKVFRGLDTAFSEIYETTDTNSLVDKFRDGFVVVAALVVAVIAMVVASIVLGALAEQIPYSEWLTPVALIAGLIVAFYPIYYVFPDTDVGVWDVFPGVVIAAVGWAAMQGLFQLYLSVADPSAGGVFGGVIVIVTYLYFSALVLLVGAVVNAVAGSHSSGEASTVSGKPGGFETERKDQLDRAGFEAYLYDLRAELFGRGARTEMVGDRPMPIDDVELVERSATGGETSEWMVTLRWEYTDEQPETTEEVTESSDESERQEPVET
jgi:membrane protein